MDKVVRNGMVAVVVSPGYGAGWTTWEDVSPFDPTVVAWIEDGKNPDTMPYKNDDGIYTGGLRDAEIEWISEGTRFEINEYDGFEDLRILGSNDGYVA